MADVDDMAQATATALAAYVPGTRAWFPDKDLGWISATLINKPAITSATGEVSMEFQLDEADGVRVVKSSLEKLRGKGVEQELPPLRNPPLLEGTDDLTSLSYLNEPAVLHAILSRYSQRSIYTYSGIVLIAVNPFSALNLYGPELIQSYSGKRRGELEPHLFAIAEDAYRCMIQDEKDQTIVVSGESGAGKTVSAKFIMRYFATVEDPSRPRSRKAVGAAPKENGGMNETERQILATNPIMEAFGNAKTIRNDNSSRFGKYIEILFDSNHDIVGAKIRTYLLERSRLVYQPENERNYHVFYQLCAGAPTTERKELGLTDASDFAYLNQGKSNTIAGVDDAEDFKETQKALSTVGLTVEKQWSVFRLLAALLHLGNVQIGATRSDAMLAQDDVNLLMATKLLGIDVNEFRKWAVKKQIVTRGEKIVSNLTQAQAIVVRDSVAKYVYSSLFDWLVDQLNSSLALGSTASRKSMIGVLDIYGFERFKVNSFEQFCINYANERLQHEFNRHVFKLEQDEYIAEEINWTFINFSDNQPTIDMIESRLGILSLLDEESRLPSGADASFLQKLYTQMEKKPEYKNSFQKPRFGSSSFTVCHYALDVSYEAEGFLEKNRDAVPDEHLALLSATTNPFLKEVLETATQLAQSAKEQPAGPGASIGADGETKAVAPRRPMGGIVKKPTLGSQFKASLVSLMATIDATNAHYIRCIKPNEAKKAWEVEPQNVLGQLRACGVLETIRISTAGYPSRRTFADFAERYYMLVPSAHWDMTSLDKAKELAAYILKTTITDADKYQVGLNKIFFRAGILAHFEQLRGQRLKVLVVLIQKNLRRNVEMKRYGNLKASTVKIQSWWRMCAAQKQVDIIRKESAATLLQTGIRRLLAQQKLKATVAAIVRIQSLVRGRAQRANFATSRTSFAAVTLQSLFRGILVRRQYAQDRKGIVLLQSCYRRRLAKKELVHLRNEAKTASHYKQVTYKLENKVVELTQNLQKRTKENKDLVAKVKALEISLQEWQGKHDQISTKSRELQTQLDQPSVPLAEFEAMIAAKQALEQQHDQSLKKVQEHESRIAALEEEVRSSAEELEARESALAKRDGEDSTTATALRAEIAKLKEDLHRASTLAQLSGNGEAVNGNSHRNTVSKPTNPDFPQLYDLTMGKEPPQSATGSRRAQRPRSAEMAGAGAVKKAQAAANRHVSVMPPQAPIVKDEDAVAEEIENILLDEAQLDEDLLQGLIQQLRTPMGEISPKECLFPSHLIALVLNEYWLRSMIRPSERVLANVMQTIQAHVMALDGDELITQAIYWISNVHELLSFVSVAESDLLAGIAPGDNDSAFGDYERLIVLAKHDLESLEYNIYHTLIDNTKRRLHKMVVPAVIESQSLPGFVENSGGRLFNRLMSTTNTPAYTMDDVLGVLNTVWRALKMYYLEASVVHQVITELMRLINSTAFNDVVLRRSFCSWKRAMQIQYNVTRIEEWCKAKGIPEAMLQLEHLSQSVKLLQLKKSTLADIDIIYDVSWVLTPSQIHKLISQYHTAEYENPISPEILKAAAARVTPNDRNDHLLLPPEVDEAGPYELPLPREVTGIETYIPAFIQAPSLRTLASLVT